MGKLFSKKLSFLFITHSRWSLVQSAQPWLELLWGIKHLSNCLGVFGSHDFQHAGKEKQTQGKGY